MKQNIHSNHHLHPLTVFYRNVRLVNCSNNAEGRVEVLYDGSWKTVCDDYWYLLEAKVVCRMVGFDGALEAPRSARFGQGSGNILGVGCLGTEDSLADCYRVWDASYCGHNKDAGAVCYSGAHPNPFQVRLIGGSNNAEGRVEVLHDGSWGTVCDDYWDLRDARVVCRMLEFDGALNAPRSARFGQGSGNILLDSVGCEGTEDNLADCGHLGVGVHYSCGHDKDAGAICYSGAHPNPLQVRLIGGSNDAEGRVEVLHDGSWGTVCDYYWDLREARVVCRMLGFDGALDAPGSARFGQGSGRVLLTYVNCDGTEHNLADCTHAGIGRYSCSHVRDAGAICYSGAYPIRLIGGSNDAEGRVEVMDDGSWGTVCDWGWDLRDARVICRMLGFDGALEAPGSATFGQGSGRVLLTNVNCDGTEDKLADCTHAGIERYPCSHVMDAGAVCYSGAHPNPFQVRLIGGSNDGEGRVEVLHDGSWGTVCDDRWDLRDARVVCRMLGFDGALDAPGSARFGQGSGRVLLKYVSCNGTEDNLADCAHGGIGRYSCRHVRDAGAICYSGAYPIRLIGGSNESEGRVEVMYDGSWATVCDALWDLRDARVVCRMLGFDGALDAPGSARFGQGSGDILYVDCRGTEDTLADCLDVSLDFTCRHDEDAGVVCYSGAHPNPFHIRLIGGANDTEGRIEIMYDGSWGTVCDNGWDLRDARVVCRMLGFDGALGAPGSGRFGQGTGRILLNYVNCDGTEDNLADCSHLGIGDYSSCGHARDASAICYLEELTTSGEFHTTECLFSSIKTEALSTELGNATFHPNTSSTHIYLSTRERETLKSSKAQVNLSLLLGISIPVPCVILIAVVVYCSCRGLTRSAKGNLDATVYMDLMHSRSTQHQNSSSIYQDLRSPPKLPERWSTVVSSQDNKSRVSMIKRPNTIEQVNGVENNTQNTAHEYMEVSTVHQIPSPDEDSDGYFLRIFRTTQPAFYTGTTVADESDYDNDPEKHNNKHDNNKHGIHKYMDMKSVYKYPPTGAYEDVEGYFLPSTTALESEYSKITETTVDDVSGSDDVARMTRHNKTQDGGHKYMDMKSVYQMPPTGTDKDLDCYVLPAATELKSELGTMMRTAPGDLTDSENNNDF